MAQESWKLEQEDPSVSPSPPDARGPCSNNCGFFGSSSTMNLCSSCYLNLLTSKASVAGAGAATSGAADISLSPTPSRPASPSTTDLLPVAPASSPLPFQQQQLQKQTPSRCLSCRKRVGLMGFKCRCGDVFCALHRYSDKHNCSFDYKAAARAAISKANPVVKADKIEKI